MCKDSKKLVVFLNDCRGNPIQPEKILRNDTLLVNYLYLADGMKMGALNSSGDGLVYRGSMTFRRSVSGGLIFESVPFVAGRMTTAGVLYHVTDHLGSVRAVVDGATGSLLECSDYSAFGTRRQPQLPPMLSNQLNGNSVSAGATFRHHFTGQEEQAGITSSPGSGTATLSLPYTDFCARQYSPTLSRWLVPDPMSEKYYDVSPYVYCANDPVNRIDQGDSIVHSAVVYSVDSNGYTKLVISKRGNEAISINHPRAPGFYQYSNNGLETARAYFRYSGQGVPPAVIFPPR